MCIFAPAIGAKKCSMCHLKTANKQIDMYKENKNLNRIKVVLAEKSAKQVSGQADWPRPSHWDLGSGTRNILRYAPLYNPDYKIEINSSTQFLFSITYQDENVPNSGQIFPTPDKCPRLRINVPDSGQMSPTEGENVPNGEKMSKKNVKNVQDSVKMSKMRDENVQDNTELSQTNVPELTDEELDVSLIPKEGKRAIEKKNRRRRAIIGLMAEDSQISLESMAEKLDVHLKSIWRDITELRAMGVIDRIGEDHGGE